MAAKSTTNQRKKSAPKAKASSGFTAEERAAMKERAKEAKAASGRGKKAADGKVVCFFQGAQKFKTRYATLGFQERANLDDGAMWPTAYALTELTPEVEARIATLVKQAAS